MDDETFVMMLPVLMELMPERAESRSRRLLSNARLRPNLKASLLRIVSADRVRAVRLLLQWWKQATRPDRAEAWGYFVGIMSEDALHQSIMDALASDSPGSRLDAARALQRMDSAWARRLRVRAIEDEPDEFVRKILRKSANP